MIEHKILYSIPYTFLACEKREILFLFYFPGKIQSEKVEKYLQPLRIVI